VRGITYAAHQEARLGRSEVDVAGHRPERERCGRELHGHVLVGPGGDVADEDVGISVAIRVSDAGE
jgi:hypothetical protein